MNAHGRAFGIGGAGELRIGRAPAQAISGITNH
jgi:hypothetical protein